MLIRVLKVGVPLQSVPGMQPLRVKVTFAGRSTPPLLYVNWRPVESEEFIGTVDREVRIRPPNWPVYVEGDPALEWQNVAWVIDMIRGLGAEVILLKAS